MLILRRQDTLFLVMTKTILFSATNGQGLQCCNQTHPNQPVFHPACRPIIIPDNDPFYLRHKRFCNNFVRNAAVSPFFVLLCFATEHFVATLSLKGPKNNCNLGFREQTNIITSFIDASMIYGNDNKRSQLVRSPDNGKISEYLSNYNNS